MIHNLTLTDLVSNPCSGQWTLFVGVAARLLYLNTGLAEAKPQLGVDQNEMYTNSDINGITSHLKSVSYVATTSKLSERNAGWPIGTCPVLLTNW